LTHHLISLNFQPKLLHLARYLGIFLFTIAISLTVHGQEQAGKDSARAQLLRASKQFDQSRIPKPIGYVNDFEGLFTLEQKAILDSTVRAFEEKTSIQVAIVTLGSSMITKDSFYAFTLRIANDWGVGQKGKDNGVLIGISGGLRIMRIHNAKGIEKILPDDETAKIVEGVFLPAYSEGKIFEGTFEGIKALMAILEKRYK
jgi:uncharacterized protein